MTSIQYEISNVAMPIHIYKLWDEGFNSIVYGGPESVKDWLNYTWHQAKDLPDYDEDVLDKDKEVTAASFEVTGFPMDNMLFILIKFPDCEIRDASCKYGLMVLTEFAERLYFTMEQVPGAYVVGEWDKDLNHTIHGIVKFADPVSFMFGSVYHILQTRYPNEIKKDAMTVLADMGIVNGERNEENKRK